MIVPRWKRVLGKWTMSDDERIIVELAPTIEIKAFYVGAYNVGADDHNAKDIKAYTDAYRRLTSDD